MNQQTETKESSSTSTQAVENSAPSAAPFHTDFMFWTGISFVIVAALAVILSVLRKDQSPNTKFGLPFLFITGLLMSALAISPNLKFEAEIAGNKLVLSQGEKAFRKQEEQNQAQMMALRIETTKIINGVVEENEEQQKQITTLTKQLKVLAKETKVAKVESLVKKLEEDQQAAQNEEKTNQALSITISSLDAIDLQDDDGDRVRYVITDIDSNSRIKVGKTIEVSAPGIVDIGETIEFPTREQGFGNYVLRMQVIWKGKWVYFGNQYPINLKTSKENYRFEYNGWVTHKIYELSIKAAANNR